MGREKEKGDCWGEREKREVGRGKKEQHKKMSLTERHAKYDHCNL